MVILRRVSSDPYICTTDLYDVDKIANVEKKVPLEWITEDGTYVSKELLNYIRPLIQAELSPIMIAGQPRHIVVNIDRICNSSNMFLICFNFFVSTLNSTSNH